MGSQLNSIDYVVFALYAIVILGVGLWVSRDKKGHEKSAEDYFVAGISLPWWAIGASLIAANISAEQFIGMSESGFAIGLVIASYEWMAAASLLIVGKFFLPIFIQKGLYTIPEFVEKRYNTTLKSILAVFWLALFVFVNLTAVLYLGAKALHTIIGTGDGSMMIIFIIGLAAFSAAYSLWGGLSAVAWTDVIQVVLLVESGILTTKLHADGTHAEELAFINPGSHGGYHKDRDLYGYPDDKYGGIFLTETMVKEGYIFPNMNGQFVFKMAIQKFPEVIKEALADQGYTSEDLDLFIPHQANLRISQFVQKLLALPDHTVYNNIQKYGNTTAASIPIALSEAWESGKVKEGDLIGLAALGSGFTWASALIKW